MNRRRVKEDVQKYWEEKERAIGERIIDRNLCEYISGYRGLDEKNWGILYYTESSFYFQIFPKKNRLASFLKHKQKEDTAKIKNFRIFWKDIKQLSFPPKRNILFNIIFPIDNRIFVNYYRNSQKSVSTLVLRMNSIKERDEFRSIYCKFKKSNNIHSCLFLTNYI